MGCKNNNSTDSNQQEIVRNDELQSPNDAINSIDSRQADDKSFMTAEFDNLPFTATSSVVAKAFKEQNKYTVVGENDDYRVEFDILKAEGSFTSRGIVTNKKDGAKIFNTSQGNDILTVTVEASTDSYFSGTFLFQKGNDDGTIQSSKNGKFLANKNSTTK